MMRWRVVFLIWWLFAATLGAATRWAVLRSEVRLDGDSGLRYEPLARNLIAGRGFSSDSRPPYRANDFDQPGYPLFMAAVYALTGRGARAVVGAQLVLELLSLSVTVRTAHEARLAASELRCVAAVGWLCPLLPLFAGRILTETLATFLFATTSLLLVRTAAGHWQQEGRGWLVSGLGAGACLLVRADFVPALLLMLLAAFAARSMVDLRRACGHLAIAIASAALAMTPWAVRSSVVLNRVSPFGGVMEQARSPYVRWLGTWVDDPRLQPDYWWRAFDPSGPTVFPAEKVGDPRERERAGRALAAAKAAGHFDAASAAAFDDLAEEAGRKRPFATHLVVPSRRVLMSWVFLPGYLESKSARAVAYPVWSLFLGCVLVGTCTVCRTGPGPLLVLVAVLLGRSVLPLASGIAAEPRYLVEAVPACLVVGTVGIRQVVGLTRLWMGWPQVVPGAPLDGQQPTPRP